MTFRLSRVTALLFCSGACALIYQVAWFRELRLIFGASTASSAAVLAVFMGGLGAGGAILGRRADRAANPLLMYAMLELGVATTAALTPLLVAIARAAYLGVGGAATLGNAGATALRLLLSVIVLLPSTFLMGGTMPAAARAVQGEADDGRRRVAILYGVNTFGAVAGTVGANFLLLETLGTRLTLWSAALLNLLVGVLARSLSRHPESAEAATEDGGAAAEEATPQSAATEIPAWLPPGAAAIAGLSFMLMELVWYRMLAPILGGSSYTFGLILAVALSGIGIGGALYGRVRWPATPRAFAVTCALEALLISIPFAMGDRLAILSALLRPLAKASFAWSISAWTLVSVIVVLPAAIVSGLQFPLIIALYGRGARAVGRHVGAAYLANTLGSIVGSIAGGFGLLPLLGALGCWKLVVASLAASALVALWVEVQAARRAGRTPFERPAIAGFVLGLTACSAGCFLTTGPTAVWRHAGIGAGRADQRLEPISRSKLEGFAHVYRRSVYWEEDGVESSVALAQTAGFAFVVNGKADGHSMADAPTQVMSGMLGAIVHPNPKRALVVGLGTGSTAGWLGAIDTMEKVDVIELEPAILRVARDCASVNRSVLDNPKVTTTLGDAREVLRTSRGRYDLIFSEPSNPYRAGISSMYTTEFYTSAAERLEDGGLFMQWMQAYEVEPWVVATVVTTLHATFPHISLWQTMGGDLLLIASKAPAPLDADALRKKIAKEPYASALGSAWRTDSLEGVLAHFTATSAFSDLLVERRMGTLNTDDLNVLEFAFARSVGSTARADEDIEALANRLGLARPEVRGDVDWDRVRDERWLFQAQQHTPLSPSPASIPSAVLGRAIDAAAHGEFAIAARLWSSLGRPPRAYGERTLVAQAMSASGTSEAHRALIELAPNETERTIFLAHWARRRGDHAQAATLVERALLRLREDPWSDPIITQMGLQLARQVSARDPAIAARLFDVLGEPFAAHAAQDSRLMTRLLVARSLSDVPRCMTALGELEPPLWDKTLLETRLACYTKAGDPRAAKAEKELLHFLDVEGTFGASIPTPKRPAGPAPPGPPDAGAASAIGSDDAGATSAGDAGASPAGDASAAPTRDAGASPKGDASAAP